MKKIALLIAVVSICFASVSNAQAGEWVRVRNNCGGYTYQRQAVVTPAPVVQNQTTVVNNLIGIPVPVNYNEPISAQGSTVYGYSSVAQAQGNVNLGLLYNQAARLTDQAQQLAGQAATDFAALVQAEGQNRTEVAKILAQGQSASMALYQTSGRIQQQQQRTFAFQVTQGPDGQLKVEQLQQNGDTTNINGTTPQSFNLLSQSTTAQNVSNISDLLKNRCVSCHSNTKASGNLNMEVEITDAQQRSILARVTSDDLKLRMPRNSDGTAGTKLTVDELRLVFNAMLSN